MSEIISIIGGTGFVGRALIENWPINHRRHLRLLVHRSSPDWIDAAGVHTQKVNLHSSDDFRQAIQGSGTLISMLRPNGDGQLLKTIKTLAPVITATGIERIIHCSSIDVYGGTHVQDIDERTEPVPITPYEREHFSVERLLQRQSVEVTILRLGAIFGPGGQNIVAIADEVSHAPTWRLAARRALYGRRRMHLVSVETVVDVIGTLSLTARDVAIPRLVITEDAALENNFAFLQEALIETFNRPRLRWVPELPMSFLKFALQVKGKPATAVARRFSPLGLQHLGIDAERNFAPRLLRYIEFLKGERLRGRS